MEAPSPFTVHLPHPLTHSPDVFANLNLIQLVSKLTTEKPRAVGNVGKAHCWFLTLTDELREINAQ